MEAKEIIENFLTEMNKPTMKVKCFKCGKEIEFPNPSHKTIEGWGCFSKMVFINANLIANGWHVRNRGIHDTHPFYCPDCWDGTDPEYGRHPKTDEWVAKGQEWLRLQEE